MSVILVDSNIILDVVTEDPEWYEWSAAALERHAEESILAINPIIYSEASVGSERIEELDEAIPPAFFRRAALPWEAGFLAGKCFLRYRRRSGAHTAPLPDFYIGAHAAVTGMSLLTRDPARFRTCFPTLSVLGPDGS